MRCHICGSVPHYLSLCHMLFTQVSAFQIANLVTGASGVPVWRRTKHVGLGKDRSRGPVSPFHRPIAQTPRWPLYPHRPAPQKQRERSALSAKKHHVGEVNAPFSHSTPHWKRHTVGSFEWTFEVKNWIRRRYSYCWKIVKSMWFMKRLRRLTWWLIAPLFNIPKGCVSASASVTHSVLIGFGLAELTGGYRISWLFSM